MQQPLDITSQRFGHLVAIRHNGSKSGGWAWECRCDCGQIVTVGGSSLRNGKTQSCGCKRADLFTSTHGGSYTREYSAWCSAKGRCHCATNKRFCYYGARGIVMCDKWRDDFAAFRRDMGPCPHGYTLERCDNDGPYSPENCRWAPWSEQYINKRTVRRIVVDGIVTTPRAAALARGLKARTVHGRIQRGYSINDALK